MLLIMLPHLQWKWIHVKLGPTILIASRWDEVECILTYKLNK